MKKMMISTFLILANTLLGWSAWAQSAGSLRVEGERGKYQIFAKVKAIRCATDQRNACDPAVFFELNQDQALPSGSYLVGFENSLYPELVEVREGERKILYLEKITVPSAVKGTKIRVFRDFSSLVEQKKIYLTMFYMTRHFFRLDKDNFGDLYLTGSWERDFVQRFTYESCARVENYPEAPAAARTVCRAWSEASTPLDLRELFNFADNGTFQEMWVTYPGDVVPSEHPRYLVSVPMTESDFVSVFPGAYRIQGETKGKAGRTVSVKVGPLNQSASMSFSLNSLGNLSSMGIKGDCYSAPTWKTDERAYCMQDIQEGCDRAQARSCQPLP